MAQLDFEKPILELENKIKELQNVSSDSSMDIAAEIKRMRVKIDRLIHSTYKNLSRDQKVQVARHIERPHFSDYKEALFSDFTPLAGDRNFAEDHALIGGIARFNGLSCVVMGQEKGHDTETRIKHNFGMTRPEGYRKAQRLVQMAEQFNLPIITFVDTAGAYPGKGAEERGQSEAIAKSIETFLRADVPIISIVIGEGGSGGAIAIAVANKIYMLEHSVYSVISPEGCASILWRSGTYAKEAANALKLTAYDLLELKLIDAVIQEPAGGAHRGRQQVFNAVEKQIQTGLKELDASKAVNYSSERRSKFLKFTRL